MSRREWSSLDPRVRRLIAVGASIEAAFRVAALVDLARRPQAEIRGPKWRWAVALTVVSSAGVLPAIYFRLGRLTR